MSSRLSLHTEMPPIVLLPSAADAAGRTGSYKSLRNIAAKVAVVCRVNQGNAAQVTFSLLQAQDESGTGSKAVQAVPVFYNADTSASDTFVQEANAGSFQTDANVKDKIVMFEFLVAELDVSNGFGHIAVETSASNAANITSAEMLGTLRYQQSTPLASEV